MKTTRGIFITLYGRPFVSKLVMTTLCKKWVTSRDDCDTSRDDCDTSRDDCDISRDDSDTSRDDCDTSRDNCDASRDELHTWRDNTRVKTTAITALLRAINCTHLAMTALFCAVTLISRDVLHHRIHSL